MTVLPRGPGPAPDAPDAPLGPHAPHGPLGPLGRIGAWCARHHWVVVTGWLALLVLVTAGHSALGSTYADNFTLPGSPAGQGAAVLKANEPGAGGQGGQLVFSVAAGTLVPHRAAIEGSVANVRQLPDVLSASDPFAGTALSKNGRAAYASVHFSTNPQQLGHAYVEQVDRATATARQAGVSVNYGGALGVAARPKNKDVQSELIGIVVAVVVLLAGFGSVFAAGLPLVSAVLAMFAGIGVLGMIAAIFVFPTVSPTLATMMGLGVGIDYAVFLSTRHRQRLLDGLGTVEAAATTVASSGRAVLVAATTVIVAMLGLYASGLSFIGELGAAGAIAVGVAALAAVTLVPALLAIAGRQVDRLHVRAPVAEASASGSGWGRYAQSIGAHPWRYLTAGVALLCVLAIPFFSMRLGHVSASADPPSYTDKKAYDTIAQDFGPGADGPLTVVVSLGSGQHASTNNAANNTANNAGGAGSPGLAGKLRRSLLATSDVALVSAVRQSQDGDVLVTTVVPRGGPQSSATATLVGTLRDKTLPQALAGTGDRAYVTGSTAAQVDFVNEMSSRLPVIIAVVVGMAFLLLLLNFRSPVLALKAALLNLLSIGAAYGVIVAAFQWGWASSLLGVTGKVPIESYVPMMMFAIVFGLSMDYEVFLLSRVQETWLRTGDNHASVATGLAATARVISCAALIMTSVFLAFLLSSNVVVKMLALGLGVSVLVDASVIRLVVVPATMFLLGRYNWWAPAWLERLLPGDRRLAAS